ncbi:MAG: EAL domain-containing response regulator [Vicinamibacteria bacterium]
MSDAIAGSSRRAEAHVLVVDDEPFILKLHAHIVTELGFGVCRTCSSGLDALRALDEGRPPDLILLDLGMPGMDGIEFIRHLVTRGYRNELILVSGEDERLLQSAAQLVRARGIAILGHLRKPVKPHQLRALVEAWEERAEKPPARALKTYPAEELQDALRRGEVTSYFQPKVLVATGEVIGVEALARWNHPTDGLVMPGSFIDVAEKHGLIDVLTRSVFLEGLKKIRELSEAGFRLSVAINLSPSTLGVVGFADFLASEAARIGVAPQDVIFEVTESELLLDRREALDVLTRLRLMRFRLSIDDFGTGYSSLAQLRDMPFDELKIDQTFVHKAATDPTARAIYEASLGLAKQLDMKTVAEGVEDQSDWDFVRSTQCDVIQGYFVGRPMPAEELQSWAETWRDRSVSGFA